MKYYAVIDTNVIVSSLLKRGSLPDTIIKLVSADTIVPLLNDEILNEYLDVLTRNKFGFDENTVDETINTLKTKSIYLSREQTLEDFIDKDDIVFYEIVMSARTTMDAYLITGNIKHYPIRNYVVTPREMLEIITKTNDKKSGV